MNKIRINKYLASIGVGSRRKIDEMLLQRRILVNGSPVITLGFKVDPQKDVIKVDGKEVVSSQEFIYIALHKPKGVISTLDLVKVDKRIYPVFALDKYSSGLVLLTNDGSLTQKLTHPKFETPKTYRVYLQGKINEWQKNKLKNVEVLEEKDNRTLFLITITEDKDRQIRRVCAEMQLNILELKRIAIGEIKLGDLPSGKWRYLSDEEIKLLKS